MRDACGDLAKDLQTLAFRDHGFESMLDGAVAHDQYGTGRLCILDRFVVEEGGDGNIDFDAVVEAARNREIVLDGCASRRQNFEDPARCGVVLAQQQLDRLASKRFRRHLKHSARRAVHEIDVAGGVDHHDAREDGIEHVGQVARHSYAAVAERWREKNCRASARTVSSSWASSVSCRKRALPRIPFE